MQNDDFLEYLLADLMQRAMVTIKHVTEDEDFDLTELTIKN